MSIERSKTCLDGYVRSVRTRLVEDPGANLSDLIVAYKERDKRITNIHPCAKSAHALVTSNIMLTLIGEYERYLVTKNNTHLPSTSDILNRYKTSRAYAFWHDFKDKTRK